MITRVGIFLGKKRNPTSSKERTLDVWLSPRNKLLLEPPTTLSVWQCLTWKLSPMSSSTLPSYFKSSLRPWATSCGNKINDSLLSSSNDTMNLIPTHSTTTTSQYDPVWLLLLSTVHMFLSRESRITTFFNLYPSTSSPSKNFPGLDQHGTGESFKDSFFHHHHYHRHKSFEMTMVSRWRWWFPYSLFLGASKSNLNEF